MEDSDSSATMIPVARVDPNSNGSIPLGTGYWDDRRALVASESMQRLDPTTAALASSSMAQMQGLNMNYYSYYILLSEKLELERALNQAHAKIGAQHEDLIRSHQFSTSLQNKAECFEKLIQDQQKQIGQLKGELELATNNVDTVGDEINRKMKKLGDFCEKMKSLESHLEQKFKTLDDLNQQRMNFMADQMHAHFMQVAQMFFKLRESLNLNVPVSVPSVPVPETTAVENKQIERKDKVSSSKSGRSSSKTFYTDKNDHFSLPLKLETLSADSDPFEDADYFMAQTLAQTSYDCATPLVTEDFHQAELPFQPPPLGADVADTRKPGTRTRKTGKGKQANSNRTEHHGVDEVGFNQGVYSCTCGDRLSSKFSLKRHIRLKNRKKNRNRLHVASV